MSSTVTPPAPSSSSARPDILPNAATASSSSQRQRGPVEEVIAKRMKQLGKKLQRYRSYTAADEKTLNADQRAAISSLPALEGAYKELEDLVRDKGPIEEQELIQAAKLREAKEAARVEAIAESGSGLEIYKDSLIQPLSSFLRLRSYLHPARPNDHEHLTFTALDLPSHLQDEVQATDILRVGRMYDDLTSGGEAAKAVLDILTSGRTGEDEETNRIHHLIHLVQQDQPSATNDASNTNETSAEDPYIAAALVESAEEAFEVVPESVISEQPLDLANGHAGHATSAPINFLQDDELEIPEPHTTEPPVELTPAPEQTSGIQPPIEPPATEPATQTPRSFAPIPTGSWADLDDEDVAPAGTEALVQTEPAAVAQPDSLTTSASEPATEKPTEIETPGDSGAPSPTASTSSPRGPRGSRGRKPFQQRPPRGKAPQGPAGHQAEGRPQQPRQQSQNARNQTAQPGQKVVDDDGFQMKVRRPSQHQQQPQRGGGRGGQGGQRGGANGSFRGRGGRGGRGGATGVPSADGQNRSHPTQAASAAQSGQPAEKPSKPSIYKSVQPSAPKSAPIS